MGEYRYRDVVNPDGIPAIVPKDLFERVQTRMTKNKKAPARRNAVVTLNYKDGTKTVSLAEIESAGLGSSLSLLGAPKNNHRGLEGVPRQLWLFFFTKVEVF